MIEAACFDPEPATQRGDEPPGSARYTAFPDPQPGLNGLEFASL